MARAVAAAVLVAAAACGGSVENPDLTEGVVTGHVANAAGGWVYVLGRPDPVVPVGADGSFRITVGREQHDLVVNDGGFRADASGAVTAFGRSGVVEVEAEGAEVRDVGTIDAATLPVAGALLATVAAETGALCLDARFEVEGTDQRKVAAGDARTALLGPLPARTHVLALAMAGFEGERFPVTVTAGAISSTDTELRVDALAAAPGCRATGGCEAAGTCGPDGRGAQGEGGGGTGSAPARNRGRSGSRRTATRGPR
jgi:hypothetical protein